MKLLGKIGCAIAAGLMGLLFFLCLWDSGARLSGKDASFLFGFAQVAVLSGSMEPVFSAGDLLIIYKENIRRESDAVAFAETGGTINTHRIIEEPACPSSQRATQITSGTAIPSHLP